MEKPRQKKRLKLEVQQVNFEKVNKLISENKKKITNIQNASFSLVWQLGKVIYELSKDLNDLERAYLYKKISELTGYSVSHLKGARHFFADFPDLPEIYKKTRIPISYFYFLSRLELDKEQRCNITTHLLNSDEITSFRDFREWLKVNYGIKFHYGLPQFCDLCGEQLAPDEKAETWFIYAIHKECLDDLKNQAKKVEELQALIKVKDKNIADWKEMAEKRGEFSNNWVELIKSELGVKTYEDLCKKYMIKFGKKV